MRLNEICNILSWIEKCGSLSKSVVNSPRPEAKSRYSAPFDAIGEEIERVLLGHGRFHEVHLIQEQ